VLIILAILSGLLLSYAIFRADKYEREPFVPLAWCFMLGAAVTIPALELEKLAFTYLQPYEKGVFVIALTAFVAVYKIRCYIADANWRKNRTSFSNNRRMSPIS
jgi:RsiW-degrading membrane proteinase PrsW (M82 family)